MRDATAIIGTLLLFAVLMWWAGALVLRLAAWGWFAFALIGFPLVGEGELDPWAPWVFAGAGLICWTGGHLLFRARSGGWRTPLAARVFSGGLRRHDADRDVEPVA